MRPRNKLLTTVCALSFAGMLQAQEAQRIEYFFDSDPGYGQAMAVEGAKEGEGTYTVDFSGLESGAHSFNIRAVDSEGNWSAVWSRAIYVYNLQGFEKVEYFIDNDPGTGNATAVPVTGNGAEQTLVFSIDISGLELGEHYMCVRAMDTLGQWSTLKSEMFTICEAVEPAGDLARLEYFFDTDPGYGKGLAVAKAKEGEGTYFMSLEGLAAGAHSFNLRAQDVMGNWSAVWSRAIYVYTLNNVAQVEYYIDNDPGEGMGTSVGTFSQGEEEQEIAFNVDLSDVGAGEHYLCVRTMDTSGVWSIVSKEPFTITESNGIEEVQWTQQVEIAYSDGVCLLGREEASDAPCNVQIVGLNGQIVAEAVWEAGSTRLEVPVNATEGCIFIVNVTDTQRGLHTAKRLMAR